MLREGVRARPRTVAAASVVALALVGASIAAEPLLASRVEHEAAARRVDLHVGSARVGWFRVELRDVTAHLHGVDALQLTIERVEIGVSSAGSPTRIGVNGGSIAIRGDARAVADQVRDWRKAAPAADSGKASSRSIDVVGLSVATSDEPVDAPHVHVSGLRAHRGAEGSSMTAEDVAVGSGAISLGVHGGELRLDPANHMLGGRAESVVVSMLAEEAKSSSPPSVAAEEAAPPPLPLPAGPVKGKKGKGKSAAVTPPPPPPHLPFPDVQSARLLLAALTRRVAEQMGTSTELEVGALTVKYRALGTQLTLGPGPASLARRDDVLTARFATPPDRKGASLAVTATLPVGHGSPTVAMKGGPVPLGLFGAAEGAFGLTEVDRTTVAGDGRAVIDEARDALSFDGELSFRNLALKSPRLADDVIRGIDLTVVGHGALDNARVLRLDSAEVKLGSAVARASGTIEQPPDHLAVSLAFDVPRTACQGVLSSIPPALIPVLRGAKVEGTFGAKGALQLDTRSLDDLVMDFKAEDKCAMTEVPEYLAKERFQRRFLYTTYDAQGNEVEEESGPQTPGWTPLDRISPFMQVAVLTTEDGGFLHHRGFSRASMRNALVANLKAGRFVRGASTITMQLAKNLFLHREKTLSRKLEELVLADYLEQIFTKEEMMEIYLNIIEFGPNLYGVRAAAQHYFGRTPAELNLAESLFLSSLLPSPVRSSKLFDQGTLSERWLNHIHDLMGIAEKYGKISKTELDDGLMQNVVFRDPKGAAPPPRAPVRGTYFTGDDNPADWQETN